MILNNQIIKSKRMFIYLNKKISIPNCFRVRCIAWSLEHEFIACGGENGMLKVIKLDNTNQTTKGDLFKNLSVNQTLDSHKATVEKVCWNEKFQKLTSSDSNGTIIVWMFYKGMWYEEMVNNRQKSLVTGMTWTHDGNKICIVYEDGAIITGSVDGSRLWGREMKSINFNQVEWSPDGKIILIGTRDLEIHILDYTGNFVKKMPLTIVHNRYAKAPEFVAIKWFNNCVQQFRPLLIAIDNGQIHMLQNENDNNPWIINCEMKITSVEWNHIGNMFAVTGIYQSNGDSNKNFLKIYSDQGEMLSMVKVPGNEIYDCSWEKDGLKLVLAVDSYLYFTNLKPLIPWCFLLNSIVFLRNIYKEKNKSLVFWELKTNKRYEKLSNNFLQMASWNHYCVVVTKMDENNSLSIDNNKKGAYCLNLYNSVGTLMDYHLTSLEIKFCCMNSTRVIVTSNDSFYIWTFKQLYNPHSFKSPYTENLYQELININDSENDVKFRKQEFLPVIIITDNHQISCLTTSEKYFLVGFDSGVINQFLLPNASCINKITMLDGSSIPTQMALNKNSTKLALTDKDSKFYIYDFAANNEETWSDGKWIEMVKFNDIWDFKWEADNNDLIVLLEKNKLIVVNLNKTLEVMEPIFFHDYICHFQHLLMKTILLDQLIVDINDQSGNYNKEIININNYIDTIECKYVKNVKDLILSKESMTDSINYALRMPELPSLWNILSHESLKNLDIETAYLAMIKNRDYKGLQFIKRLNKFKDENLKRAEIHAYQNEFEEAEKIYLQLDRPDLALHLNKIIGNYKRVQFLLEKYNSLPHCEKEMEQTNLNLGEYYADNYEWNLAIEHFEKVNAYEKLVECYINQEKYDTLISLIDKISDEKTLLQMAMFLESSGFCQDSVRAYIKANNFEMAINACIHLNEWKMASELANQYKTKNIDIVLEKYAQHLEDSERYIEMIEIYRKANKMDKAVMIIMKLIEEIRTKNKYNVSILKKLYVLIGILYEENKSKDNPNKYERLDELLSQNDILMTSLNNKQFHHAIEDPWKGAEAYHFFLLTQRYLYRNEYNAAMNTALHLQNYEEYLTLEQIYSIIALTAYVNKCYDICSKAFIKLESLGKEQKWDLWISDLFNVKDNSCRDEEIISKEKRNQYEQLAVQIFLRNPPDENLNNVTFKVNCKFCGQTIPEYGGITCSKCKAKFPACVASGKSIINPRKNWTCKRCGHHAIQEEINLYKNCPLCHEKID